MAADGKRGVIPLLEGAKSSFKQEIAKIIRECVPSKTLSLREPSCPFFFKLKSLKGRSACFLFLEKKRGVERFVFDMLSNAFLQTRRLDFASFETFSVSYPSKKKFVAMRVFFDFLSVSEIREIQGQLKIFIKELSFGAASYYQGLQILELKGSQFEEKILFLQTEVKKLIQRFPRQFDYDIYPLMKQILLALPESYKKERSQKAMLRSLMMFYRLRGLAKKFHREKKEGRFVAVDAALIGGGGKAPVLSICLSISLSASKEVLEKKQVLQLVGKAQNFFDFTDLETGIRQFYLEIEAIGFKRKTLMSFKQEIEKKVSQFVQPLVRPIFMPRNEEEVMKSLVTLSSQIQSEGDLPQVMIHFEHQTEKALIFRVLMARVLKKEGKKNIHQMVELSDSAIKVAIERVRKLRMVEGATSKEAIVLLFNVPLASFVRSDGRLDLFKARHEVIEQLRKIFGDVRDFNGTMMEQHIVKLKEMKAMVKEEGLHEELEHFFFSLYPVEFRAIWPSSLLVEFFEDLLRWKEKGVKGMDVFFTSFVNEEEGNRLFDALKGKSGLSPQERILMKFHFSGQKIVGFKDMSLCPV